MPDEAQPLAYADCMAPFGWLPYVGRFAAPDALADYRAANTTCTSPVAGASKQASYCRFVNAIYDRGFRDETMSIAGVPVMGIDDARRAAAVALYDQAIEFAPDELVDDLRSMREGFGDGGRGLPDGAATRLLDHNVSVCGVSLYLGSLD